MGVKTVDDTFKVGMNTSLYTHKLPLFSELTALLAFSFSEKRDSHWQAINFNV